MKWLKTIALSAVLMGLFIGNSVASEIVASADVVDAPTVVGLGVAMVPDYIGSDDYKAVPLPFLKYTFRNSQRYIKLAGPELSVNLLDIPNLYLGPMLRYYGSRDDDIDDAVVKKMNKVDAGLAAGAFLTYEIKEADPRNKINLTLKFLADVSDSYDGYLIDFDATLWRKVEESWDVFIGAGTTYADGDYMDTYFGVNNGNRGSATVFELPNYSADSGIRDVRIQAGTIYHYDKNWLFGGLVRYQRLVGDAEDSPVVDDRGDPNQMAIALFVGYKW
jgi:outer membrane protein